MIKTLIIGNRTVFFLTGNVLLWTNSTNKAKGVVLQPPLISSRHDIDVCAAFVLVGESSVRLERCRRFSADLIIQFTHQFRRVTSFTQISTGVLKKLVGFFG